MASADQVEAAALDITFSVLSSWRPAAYGFQVNSALLDKFSIGRHLVDQFSCSSFAATGVWPVEEVTGERKEPFADYFRPAEDISSSSDIASTTAFPVCCSILEWVESAVLSSAGYIMPQAEINDVKGAQRVKTNVKFIVEKKKGSLMGSFTLVSSKKSALPRRCLLFRCPDNALLYCLAPEQQFFAEEILEKYFHWVNGGGCGWTIIARGALVLGTTMFMVGSYS